MLIPYIRNVNADGNQKTMICTEGKIIAISINQGVLKRKIFIIKLIIAEDLHTKDENDLLMF
jgi:hypothetical protein